ncbi:polymeric immunoglobulin receptor-like isoform X1 [Brachyhypopomus gauderio]|uniref:polymeric immunoglobulin receptor-like isoform X1 n=1 Tax=Brachyhypopomus gauderio TaxID=698409 RepID=UPI0040410C8D
MLVCVFLLYCGLQVTAGCTRMDSQEFSVSRSPGESVLLSCRCPDNHDIIKWIFGSSTQSTDRTVVSNEAGHYRGRVFIFDQTPSSNFSLLISNLSEEDTGHYYCGESTYVYLIVRGCSLSENKQHVEVSGSAGESVFLSCSCTHLRGDAWSGELRVKWRSPHYEDLHSTQLSPHYSGRVQMFNEGSPGNLSLLISDLTEKDRGLYSCWINHNQHRNFTLTVKGCTLSESPGAELIKYPGESVLLPCFCTDHHTKPASVKWEHLNSSTESAWTEVSNGTRHHRDRIHMSHQNHPANLSLLLSNLTEEDQGTYRCTVNNNQSISIHLSIKVFSPSENVNTPVTGDIGGRTINNPGDHQSPNTNHNQTNTDLWKEILMSSVLLLVLLVLLVFAGTYCTCVKGRKHNSQEKRGERKHNEDDVIYSSFDHGKKGQRTQRQVEESVIYSDTVFDRKRPSAGEECELTYSTLSHAKKKKRALRQDNTEEPTVYSSLKTAKKLQME